MAVDVAVGLALVWVALMVAALVWALRARRQAREEQALDAAASAGAVDLTEAPADLDDLEVDLSDPLLELPTQRDA